MLRELNAATSTADALFMIKMFADYGALVLLAYVVVPYLAMFRGARQIRVQDTTQTRTYEVVPGAMPPHIMAEIAAATAHWTGFSPLALLTTAPLSCYAGCQAVLVNATRTTAGTTMVIQHKPMKAPAVVHVLMTVVECNSQPRLLCSATSGAALTSGTRPGVVENLVPGASPEQLIAAHESLVASLPRATRLAGWTSTAAFIAFTEYENHALLSWRLQTRRLQRRPDGSLQLSWAQCAWWASRSHPLGKPALAAFQRAAGRRVLRRATA